MEDLADRIGQLCNLLEDAKDERDWDLVTEVIDKLDELYDELDKSFFEDDDLY